jgi:threonine dehydrogenase-like Zn-dependent dehydrogenase
MVHGRTTAPSGLILGHEITGEIIDAGEPSASTPYAGQPPRGAGHSEGEHHEDPTTRDL